MVNWLMIRPAAQTCIGFPGIDPSRWDLVCADIESRRSPGAARNGSQIGEKIARRPSMLRRASVTAIDLLPPADTSVGVPCARDRSRHSTKYGLSLMSFGCIVGSADLYPGVTVTAWALPGCSCRSPLSPLSAWRQNDPLHYRVLITVIALPLQSSVFTGTECEQRGDEVRSRGSDYRSRTRRSRA